MEARIQKLPSSKCGRNSLPSRGAISKKVPREKASSSPDHESAVIQRKTQRRIVNTVQQADDDRFGFLHVLGEQQGSEHGRDGERRDQSPGQRVAVSARHGAEDLALDSLHGEQRHETGHRDERREENRLVHLQRADQNQPQAIRPSVSRRCIFCASASGRAPRNPPPDAASRLCLSSGSRWKFRKIFSTRITAESTMMPKSTAPTDSRLALSPLNHQENGGEEQRERDVQPNDDRAAEIAEENPLDQEDQQASENQVVQNRVRGEGDQRGAVIKRNNLDSRRQAPVVIQSCRLPP